MNKNRPDNPHIDTKNIQCKHDIYFHEIEDFYISPQEQNRIYNKFFNNITHYVGNNVDYTDDEFFVKTREKYPFLSDKVTFSFTKAGTIPLTHIDAPRNCTFNFPIHNCGGGAPTVWFDLPGPYHVNFMGEGVYGYYTIMGKKTPMTSYTLDSEKGKACLFRTTLPHCVVNQSRDQRVIVTWSVDNYKLLDDVIADLKSQ